MTTTPTPAKLMAVEREPFAYVTDDRKHIVFADRIKAVGGMTPLYLPSPARSDKVDRAIEIIASNAGAAIPEGFKLLSREPVEAMIHAAEDLPAPRMFGTVWRAMWDAAPSNSPAGAKEQTK